MSTRDGKWFFTSEAVTMGHPDNMADQVSDAILDAIIKDDPNARVACETLVKTGMVLVAGEITTNTYIEVPEVVRQTVKEIGYDSSEIGFDYHTCAVLTAVSQQSADIDDAVTAATHGLRHRPRPAGHYQAVDASHQQERRRHHGW